VVFIRRGMEGWIKLYRQIIENDVWKYDQTAWHVFEYFLATCDYKTGQKRFGRLWLSEYLKINASTLYKAIRRLEKAKMVTLSSNNKFTILTITNWHKYQGNGNSSGNNKVTTKEQQSNTYKEVKNKELKKYITAKNLENLKNKYNLEFEEELQQWEDHHISKGTKIKDYDASFRTWCRNAKLYGRELKDKKIEIIRRQK
jgi:hypothetical protein